MMLIAEPAKNSPTLEIFAFFDDPVIAKAILTHCGRGTQICLFNTVKLGTSASSP